MLVSKFGGSSLADAEQFRKVKEIVLADKNRKYIIPSAPGKRGSGDEKITDLLYQAAACRQVGSPFYICWNGSATVMSVSLRIWNWISRWNRNLPPSLPG